MVRLTRRDFLKMAGVAGVGIASFIGGAFSLRTLNTPNENRGNMVGNMPSKHTWVSFLASANEAVLDSITTYRGDILNRYHVREVVPVRGEPSTNLAPGWSLMRVETSVPPQLSDESSFSDTSVIQFHGVRQHLHYTSEAQRGELSKRAIPELEPSEQTTAVLIPIGKSEDWWKLAQDQRQAYFQKTSTHEGHTAIGSKYVDRVFRKLYHSRYLDIALDYDFLTYFEFKDAYADDFKSLLAELRDPEINPEWAYVSYEFEIWMTKVA